MVRARHTKEQIIADLRGELIAPYTSRRPTNIDRELVVV